MGLTVVVVGGGLREDVSVMVGGSDNCEEYCLVV